MIRTQFTITASASRLSTTLDAIADADINICALSLIRTDCRHTTCRFVVGTSSAEIRKDVQAVKSILKDNDLCYKDEDVLQVFFLDNDAGEFSNVYSALAEEIKVYAAYMGEEDSCIFQVNNLCSAERIVDHLE